VLIAHGKADKAGTAEEEGKQADDPDVQNEKKFYPPDTQCGYTDPHFHVYGS
jgi:hypothetical protein